MSILPQPLASALAPVTGLTAALNTAAFAFGATGSPSQTIGQFPVVLGTVALQGFEVPDSAPWGGAQALTVHKLIGGARIIDAMGVDDRAISLKGTFLSPDADARALQIDKLRKAGQSVPFSYANHVYLVVIKEFLPAFERPDRVPYTLTLEVLQDQTQPAAIIPLSDDELFGAGLLGLATGGLALLGGLLAVAEQGFATIAAAAAAVDAAIAAAEALNAAASLGILSAVTQQQAAIAALLAAVAGGISGPVIASISLPLQQGGSISASSTDALALMLAPLAAAQAMVAAALDYADDYLAGLPVFGGVAGSSVALAAARLTTAAALAEAYAELQAIQAQLIVMQRIIATTGP